MAKDLTISVLLDFYGALLTEKQLEAATLYHDQDLSLAEISEHFGITRQGVRDSIKRAEFQLQEFEQKLGNASRFAQIQEKLEEISTLAKTIVENRSTYIQQKSAISIIDIVSEISI